MDERDEGGTGSTSSGADEGAQGLGSRDFRHLAYKVELSIRYHDRRRAFFETVHVLSQTLSLLSGAAVVATALAKMPVMLVGLGILVTVVSIFNIAAGCTAKTRLHHELQRRYLAVKRTFMAEEHSETNILLWWKQVYEIDADEPPVKHALLDLVHNEYCRRIDSDPAHYAKVGLVRRLLAQFIDLGATPPTTKTA